MNAWNETDEYRAAHPVCPGCGRGFKGERGLRTHQTAKFVTMACKPVEQER